MSWLNKIFRSQKSENDDILQKFNEQRVEIRNAGNVDNEHYTDSVEQIKHLKREGRSSEAIELLIKCVAATENEAKSANSKTSVLDKRFSFLVEGRSENNWGVAPWYYEQLAILYRKEKLYQKEVEILERYAKQKKAPGAGPQKLAERLEKARELARKHA